MQTSIGSRFCCCLLYSDVYKRQLSTLQAYISSHLQFSYQHKLKELIYEHLFRVKLSSLTESVSAICEKIDTDTLTCANYVMEDKLQVYIDAVLAFLITGILFFVDWQICLLVLLLAIFNIGIYMISYQKMFRIHKAEKDAQTASFSREAVSYTHLDVYKRQRQRVLKITEYAERLLEDLELCDWPQSTKEMQINWIGKSQGANVIFKIKNTDKEFTVFTTRCDTLFGATYCVMAPEHPYVDEITTAAQKEQIAAYKKTCASKSDLERTELNKEKTGVFTGAYAVSYTHLC